jgi:hypothetical protein
MPSDDGLRLEDFHRVQHLESEVIEPRKYQAIDIADGNPLRRPTPQHIELMPKGENLGLRGARDRNSPTTAYQINLRRSPIAVIIDRFAGDRQLFWVYGRYRVRRRSWAGYTINMSLSFRQGTKAVPRVRTLKWVSGGI